MKYEKVYVVYHGNCSDGQSSSWSAWKDLGAEAIYIPMSHDFELPDFGTEPAKIYCLDYAFKREDYDELSKLHDIIIIDHHASNAKAYASLKNSSHVFDMTHSGAVLAWKYFHSTEVPEWLLYVEDRDLFLNRLPRTQAFTAAIMNKPKSIEVYDAISKRSIKDICDEGELLLEDQRYMIHNILRNHNTWATITDHDLNVQDVPIVNSNVFQSDVAAELNRMYPEAPFAIYYHQEPHNGLIKVGLRNARGYDVSLVATHYGGGGHPGAAAFHLSQEDFRDKIYIYMAERRDSTRPVALTYP